MPTIDMLGLNDAVIARRPVPEFTVPTVETRTAMEARMDAWFDKKRRGRGCRDLTPREVI